MSKKYALGEKLWAKNKVVSTTEPFPLLLVHGAIERRYYIISVQHPNFTFGGRIQKLQQPIMCTIDTRRYCGAAPELYVRGSHKKLQQPIMCTI